MPAGIPRGIHPGSARPADRNRGAKGEGVVYLHYQRLRQRSFRGARPALPLALLLAGAQDGVSGDRRPGTAPRICYARQPQQLSRVEHLGPVMGS